MGSCETCGNTYDKAFTVTTADGRSHVFDCIECAAAAIAPTCDHCGTRILGHGSEVGGRYFCCAHCAREEGIHELEDRVAVGTGVG